MDYTLEELKFVRRALEVRMKAIDQHFNSMHSHSVSQVLGQIRLEALMKSTKEKVDREIARLEGCDIEREADELVRQVVLGHRHDFTPPLHLVR